MSVILPESFFFVRHAQTDWNMKELCQGSQDIPLNEKGRCEARCLAELTCNLTIECIIIGSLQRTVETADELNQVHKDAQMHIVNELKERGWGEEDVKEYLS